MNKMLKIKNSIRHRAFTLIEVLISIFILSLMSFSVYEIVTTSLRVSEESEGYGEFRNNIRVVMKLLQNDLQLAFLPLGEAELYQTAPTKPTVPGAGGRQAPLPNPYQNPNAELLEIPPTPGRPQSIFSPFRNKEIDRGVRESRFYTSRTSQLGSRLPRFIGEPFEVSFISSAHEKIYEGSKTSVFSKIHYYIEEKEKTLMRWEDLDVFYLEDKTSRNSAGTEWPVLEHLEKGAFRYYDWATSKWVERWDSNHPDFLDRYPSIVEFSFSLKDTDGVTNDYLYRFSIEVSQIQFELQKEEVMALRTEKN